VLREGEVQRAKIACRAVPKTDAREKTATKMDDVLPQGKRFGGRRRMQSTIGCNARKKEKGILDLGKTNQKRHATVAAVRGA